MRLCKDCDASWHQIVQDFVGEHISHRLAMKIFHWRVSHFIRRGRVQSAHIEEERVA